MTPSPNRFREKAENMWSSFIIMDYEGILIVEQALQEAYEQGIKESAELISEYDDLTCSCEVCNLSKKILSLLIPKKSPTQEGKK